MTADDDRVNLLDFRRAACLCDAGLSDYVAVATVAPDGQIATLWLWHRDGPDRAYPGAPPVHERTGPLPADWNSQLARAGPRCGQPRADGQPCRRHVTRPGQPCHQHRSRTTR
jgi:hypothetical protein